MNRHEFDCVNGRAITTTQIHQDILIMKTHNINALRTSHYPNHPLTYDLCDEIGILVMDETNLETHGTWNGSIKNHTLPGDDMRWWPSVAVRITSMIRRNRTHACVVAWSLGNESYAGTVMENAYRLARELDATRFIHYEGESCKGDESISCACSDVLSRMYYPPEKYEVLVKKHLDIPVMLCEFSHSMGNSTGGLAEYMGVFDQYPNALEGFVWDFMDQAFLSRKSDGTQSYLCGGMFGDTPHDGYFCVNGLLYANRTASPKLLEVKYHYQPVLFKWDGETGTIRLRSRQNFLSLSSYRLRWEYRREETLLREGEQALPDSMCAEVVLPLYPDGATLLNLSVRFAQKPVWEDWRFEAAREQFELKPYFGKIALNPGGIAVCETFGTLCLEAGDVTIRFLARGGDLYSYCRNGIELLREPVRPEFWRAPTDNDRGAHLDVRLAVWRNAGRTASGWLEGWERLADGSVRITVAYCIHTEPESHVRIQYQVDSIGTIYARVYVSIGENLPMLPAVGVIFETARRYERICWFGRGPLKNYGDRKGAAAIGEYETSLESGRGRYLRPQENGNLTDVRRLTLLDKSDAITFVGEQPLEVQVSRLTPQELGDYRDDAPSPLHKGVVVRIMERQMGIGGDDSWGSLPREAYRLPSGKDYCFAFYMLAK